MADAPKLYVEFFIEAQEDAKASKEAGRPIYKDREFVRIRTPGDRRSEVVAYADQKTIRDPETGRHLTYREVYPEHYEAFLKGVEQATIGTPLEELPFLTAAKRAEYKAQSITTAEMLAGLDDRIIRKMGMHTRDDVNKAQAYLDRAAGVADNSAMQAEIEKLKAQLAGMQTPAAAEEPTGPTEFDDFDEETLKEIVKDATGRRPAGNPSKATLVKMCVEIQKEKEREAA